MKLVVQPFISKELQLGYLEKQLYFSDAYYLHSEIHVLEDVSLKQDAAFSWPQAIVVHLN